MKAFLAVKYHEDMSNRAHIEALEAAIEQAGFDCMCIVRDVERWGQVELDPRELMGRTFEELGECQLLVADLAEKAVGLGIEAGYAYARGMPILTVAPQSADVSTTLEGISLRVYRYAEPAELVTPLREWSEPGSAAPMRYNR